MNAHISTNLKTALLAAVLLLLNSTNLFAITPACGTILTSNTTFDSDMNCPSTAIFFDDIGSNNLVLDCAGFTIAIDDNTAVQANDVSGITIENCQIVNASGIGISGRNLVNSEISNNTITTANTFSAGISFSQSSSNLVDSNTIVTTGPSSRGIQIENLSLGNVVSNNNVVSEFSNGLRVRSGSDFNTFTQNSIASNSSNAVAILSASNNQFTGNTFASPVASVFVGKLSLQNGGMSVDGSGNLFAVENNFGSSGGSGGGVTTLIQVDPGTGGPISYRRLTLGGEDLGFGFDSLEILPDGRFLATRGGGNSSLYEINPLSGEVSLLPLTLPALDGGVNGLQVVDNDTLLATTNRGELVSIDLVSSTGVLLGEDGNGWSDLALHPTSGRLYVSSRWSTEASGTSHLWEIDPANGAIIGEIGDTGIPFLADMDFSVDGVLYGNNWLAVIDETSGVGTYIGGFGEDPHEPPSLNNTFDNSECDIRLNQSIYIDGDTVTADVFRLVNMSAAALPVELKFWLSLPGVPPVSILNLGTDGGFVLPLGADLELGPIPLLPVTAGLPRGSYEFSCRFLDPVTGEQFTEDRNFFEVQ